MNVAKIVGMQQLTPGTITDVVSAYRGCAPEDPIPPDTDPATIRGLSWDVCRLHFAGSKLKRNPAKRELDRLHLATYLSAQGLVQAASPLLTSFNVHHYDEALEVLRAYAKDLVEVDMAKFHKKKTRRLLLAAHEAVSLALLPNSGGTATAASKTLVGVFGCLPGFDGAFSTAMRDLSEDAYSASTFVWPNRDALDFISAFHAAHADEIDELAEAIRVVDVATGEYTDIPVGRARVLEMFTAEWAARLNRD